MGRCRTPEELRLYLEGRLPSHACRAVEEHIEACPDCLGQLDALSGLTVGLAGHAHAGLLRLAGAVEAAEDELIEQVRRKLIPAAPIRRPGLTRSESPSGDWNVAPGQPARFESIGPYILTRLIGMGGMGAVFEARDTRLGRRVALKILRQDATSPSGSERLLREAELLAGLNHPNIVPVYEVGEHEGRPYLVLEYVGWGTLCRLLGGRAQPPRAAAEATMMLARAVHHAHEQGIIHRDLKPANVLLRPVGPLGEGSPLPSVDAFRLMISDLGLAKRADGLTRLTHTGQPIGTPAYMSPEQAAGEAGKVGPATDIYALGAILYEMLTGRPPFPGADVSLTIHRVLHEEPVRPRVQHPALPRDLETICLKCLEKEPARRYATAADLAADLGRFLGDESIEARPVGPAGRAWKWCHRNIALAAALSVAAVLLLTLAAGGVAFALIQSEQRQIAESLRHQANARTLEAQSLAHRAQEEQLRADLNAARSIDSLSKLADRLFAMRAPSPEVRETRDFCLEMLRQSLEEHVRRAGPPGNWTMADLAAVERLAWIEWHQGDRDKAAALGLQMREAAIRILGRNSRNTVLHRHALKGLVHPALLAWHRSQRAEAAFRLEQITGEARALVADFGPDRDDLEFLASHLFNLDAVYEQMGLIDRALATARKGIEVQRERLAIEPNNPDRAAELARRLARCGRFLVILQRPSEAAPLVAEAMAMAEALVRNRPGSGQAAEALELGRTLELEIRGPRRAGGVASIH